MTRSRSDATGCAAARPAGRRAALLGLAALAAPCVAPTGARSEVAPTGARGEVAPTGARGWRPGGPVRIVVAAAAGGTLDIHARAAAALLHERLGQPVVVENNGGASGRLAAAAVARAAPDGLVLLVASGDGLVIGDILHGRDQGGALRPRLRPVTLTMVAAQLLVTHPASGIRSAADYVAAARRGQGVTLGTPGHGGIAHMISEMVNQAVGGLRVVHVPYRGGGPATLDLLAGQIDAMVITLPAVTDHVRAGRLRPIAVSTLRRDPAMPEVPTIAETLVPGFDVPSTQGALVPAATPDAVVDAWEAAFRAALREPSVERRLTGLGFVVTASTPAEFRDSMATAEARFAAIVASAGIRAGDG